MKYVLLLALVLGLAVPASADADRHPNPPPRVEAPADTVGTWWPDGMVCAASVTENVIRCAYRPGGKRIAE
jgi:hypothetical protein